MYHVQRFGLEVAPGEADRRLAGYLTASGFKVEDGGGLPCARYERGDLMNNFFVASPRLWRARVDVRIEPAGSGGSRVDAAWDIKTVSQIVIYTETRYWRTVLREFKRAGESGTVGPEESNAAARLSLACLLSLIAVALGLGCWLGLAVLQVTDDLPGLGIRLSVLLGVTFAVLLCFRDWRGLRG